MALVRLMRPRQSVKNLFCLAGVLFGPDRLSDSKAWMNSLATVAVFSFLSSAVYIANDIIDRDRDRLHPRKKNRPIASGVVSVPIAVCLALILGVGSLAASYLIGKKVFACLFLYLVNNALYSTMLKHMALFDALCIAFGFVLRLLAGIYASGDLPTTWITLCTFFLTVFLSFCKRRAELADVIPESDLGQRPVLSKYSVQFLDYLVSSSAVMVVMCYALFSATGGKSPSMVLTVPIVYFAVMHYKRLVIFLKEGEEPERILLRDIRLQLSIILWLAVYFGVTHSNVELFR